MSRIVKSIVAGAAVTLLAGSAYAGHPTVKVDDNWTLELSGQLRDRLVMDSERSSFDEANTNLIDREYVTQRMRIGTNFKHKSGLGIFVSLQDVRVWGEETNTLNDYSANGFDAHEAYAVIPLYEGSTLKLGRQEMVFDNSRLVGNVGWTQRARAFDGVRGHWDMSKMNFDLFLMTLNEDDADGDGSTTGGELQLFSGFHGHFDVSKSLGVSAALYNVSKTSRDEDGDKKTFARRTAGVYAKGKSAGAHYEAEFYYQFGDMLSPTSGETESISAMMGAVRGGYTLGGPMKPSFTVWGEYLSGNEDGKPEEAFDTLFATNHKFYGEMDYVLNVPATTGNRGLIDMGGRIGAKINSKLGVHVDVHNLTSVEENAAGDTAFGMEVDTKLVYNPMPHVGVRAVYGMFMPGDALGDDAETQHFMYLTTDVKF